MTNQQHYEYTAATRCIAELAPDGFHDLYLVDEHGDRVSPNHSIRSASRLTALQVGREWLNDPTDVWVRDEDKGEHDDWTVFAK